MQSKQYFTKIKNYPHEKSTEPRKQLALCITPKVVPVGSGRQTLPLQLTIGRFSFDTLP